MNVFNKYVIENSAELISIIERLSKEAVEEGEWRNTATLARLGEFVVANLDRIVAGLKSDEEKETS